MPLAYKVPLKEFTQSGSVLTTGRQVAYMLHTCCITSTQAGITRWDNYVLGVLPLLGTTDGDFCGEFPCMMSSPPQKAHPLKTRKERKNEFFHFPCYVNL